VTTSRDDLSACWDADQDRCDIRDNAALDPAEGRVIRHLAMIMETDRVG